MKRFSHLPLSLFVLAATSLLLFRIAEGRKEPAVRLFDADDKRIQYVGRIDFADSKKPRFWSPGVYIKTRFTGTSCDVLLNDEVLWGKSHNYVEIAVDNQTPYRVQATGPTNTFHVGGDLKPGTHTLTICKDTEANIGYLEFVGIRCAGLASPPALPKHKLEFIGDSITCGAGSDMTGNPCGKGEWYDQHNAYLSYGAVTARQLNAQWHLTSYSGIGLMHSCCDMKQTMPDVFAGMNLRDGSGVWDFTRYQPDAVTVCLGQNDGIQDEAKFTDNYVAFLKTIRSKYPNAQIVCLTSPMGDVTLTAALKVRLSKVVERMNAAGDKKVSLFAYSRSYNNGCGGHPDLAQHQLIADELTAYLKTTLKW